MEIKGIFSVFFRFMMEINDALKTNKENLVEGHHEHVRAVRMKCSFISKKLQTSIWNTVLRFYQKYLEQMVSLLQEVRKVHQKATLNNTHKSVRLEIYETGKQNS